METTAVLVNTLMRALESQDPKAPLTENDIDAIFTATQAKRYQRAVDAVNQGRHTNSASIRETFFSKIFVDYFFPRFGQSLIFSLIVKNTLSGPFLDGIPVPARYIEANERYEQRSQSRDWMFWGLILLRGGALITSLYHSYTLM